MMTIKNIETFKNNFLVDIKNWREKNIISPSMT